jgi:hypothetical protein
MQRISRQITQRPPDLIQITRLTFSDGGIMSLLVSYSASGLPHASLSCVNGSASQPIGCLPQVAALLKGRE